MIAGQNLDDYVNNISPEPLRLDENIKFADFLKYNQMADLDFQSKSANE